MNLVIRNDYDSGCLRGVTPPRKDEITPYDAGAGVNYPGVSNALFLPYDLYCTGKSLFKSIQRFDNEEFKDSFFRLLGFPGNAMYVVAGSAFYANFLGVISKIPLYPTLYGMGIGGLVLCGFELIVETTSLLRQKRFEKTFNFEMLSTLRTLTIDLPEDPKPMIRSIKKLDALIKKNSTQSTEMERLEEWVESAHQKTKTAPEELPTFLKESSTFLEPIVKTILIAHLEGINQRYLSITEEEKKGIESTLLKKNPTLKEEALKVLLEEEMRKSLIAHQKKLARRIRPWATEEAAKTITPLIDALRRGEGGFKEGLQLSEDIRIQSKKKTIAHLLAIATFLFTIGSLVCMLITCPLFVPYVLAGVAMTFGCLRYGIFSGSLDSRGWTFERKKMIPLCIRKWIFSEPGSNPIISHTYQKVPYSQDSFP